MTHDTRLLMKGAFIAAAVFGFATACYIVGPPPAVSYTYDATTNMCFAQVRGANTANVVPCTDAVIKAAGK